MYECGLVFFAHDGEIEVWSFFEVVAQVVIGFDVHDEIDGLGLGGRGLLAAAHGDY